MPSKAAVQKHHHAIGRVFSGQIMVMIMREEKKTSKENNFVAHASLSFLLGTFGFFFPSSTFKFFRLLCVSLILQRGDWDKGRATWRAAERGTLGQLSRGQSPIPSQLYHLGKWGRTQL